MSSQDDKGDDLFASWLGDMAMDSVNETLIKLLKEDKKDIHAISKLLKEGADPRHEEVRYGEVGLESETIPIIHFLFHSERFNKDVFKILLDAGADINSSHSDINYRGGGNQVF